MAIITETCMKGLHHTCGNAQCQCYCHMSNTSSEDPKTEKHACNNCNGYGSIIRYKYTCTTVPSAKLWRCSEHYEDLTELGWQVQDCDERPIERCTSSKQPVVRLTRPKTLDYVSLLPSKLEELVEECLIYYADRYQYSDGRAFTFHDCPAHWVIVKWVEEPVN